MERMERAFPGAAYDTWKTTEPDDYAYDESPPLVCEGCLEETGRLVDGLCAACIKQDDLNEEPWDARIGAVEYWEEDEPA